MNTDYLTVEEEMAESAWVKKLPAILRSFGAIAVLCSLYSFLMKGWQGSDDLLRYFMLLGHTGLLAVIGLASGHYFKEGKSARLLIMLAMISVVATSAVLGALIFFEVTTVNADSYPFYMVWGAENPLGVALASLVSLLIIVPVIIIGFRVLSRGMSHKMSLLFMLSNAALLIPLRDPVLVAILAAVLGSYTLFFQITTTRQRTEAKTREGMFALLLQFFPVMTLLVRNMWLYDPNVILFASASLMGFIGLRQCSLFMKQESLSRALCEIVSLFLSITTGIGLCMTLDASGLVDSIALVVATIISALMCYEISLRAGSGRDLFRIMTSVILVGGMMHNYDANTGIFASLSLLLVGIAMITMSHTLRLRSMLMGGSLLVIVGLFDQIAHVFVIFDFSYWITSAVIGVLAIIFASVIESKGGSIKRTLITYKARYAEWSY